MRQLLGDRLVDCCTLRYSENDQGDRFFGEHSANAQINGRGLRYSKYGSIRIGNWKNGIAETGKMIYIGSDGVFQVGSLLRNTAN